MDIGIKKGYGYPWVCFFLAFCASMTLNVFYLMDEPEQGQEATIADEQSHAPILDLANPDMRYDELMCLYQRVGVIAQKTILNDIELNAISQQIQIISILEMRDIYLFGPKHKEGHAE